MSSATARDDFLEVSRRFLEILGPDGVGSEYEQQEYAVNGVEPRWVLLPADPEQCSQILAVCSSYGIAVVPASFGARLGQGSPPLRFDAVVSLSRMDRIIDHAAADLTLTVEAGASLAEVNRQIAAAGQCLPLDPPFAERTSIGGLIAAQASGPCRQQFGTVRESLIGLRAILADGTPVKSGGRVVKNVAGYDLQKLLVGSFGTLAVIVEAMFKLRPVAEETSVLTYSAEDLSSLAPLTAELAASSVSPLLLEWLVGTGPPRLVVGLAGVAEEIAETRRRVAELAARAPVAVHEESPLTREAISAAVEDVAGGGAEDLVLRAGMPPSALDEWLVGALGVCASISTRVSAHAHAGVGVARLRLDSPDRERLDSVVSDLRRAAAARAGYLAIEHTPHGLRLDVWGAPSAGFSLMKGVKAAFDPGSILSPGRFIGGI
jgi:glycolate oxidase FAD binding subunit